MLHRDHLDVFVLLELAKVCSYAIVAGHLEHIGRGEQRLLQLRGTLAGHITKNAPATRVYKVRFEPTVDTLCHLHKYGGSQ